jgi:hypothetical protein
MLYDMTDEEIEAQYRGDMTCDSCGCTLGYEDEYYGREVCLPCRQYEREAAAITRARAAIDAAYEIMGEEAPVYELTGGQNGR